MPSLTQWIKKHRAELDAYIEDISPRQTVTDHERRLWVLNDEYLYRWAIREGVAI